MFEKLRKVVFASSLGGALEMYDFVIYVFFAPILSKLFFSRESQFAGILSVFAVFAVGYFIRPLGGLLFGHLGDRLGRKKTLIFSIMLMGVSTILMGCLPTYAHAGIAAPILLTLLRLLQGLAVGGDLAGAITFVAEESPIHLRGEKCAWVYLGVNFGIVFASALGALLSLLLTSAQLDSWGWRLAFYTSVVILVLGLYFRQRIDESALFSTLQSKRQLDKHPILTIFRMHHIIKLILGAGIVWLVAVIIAQIFLYMPTFLHVYLKFSMTKALWYNTGSLIIFSILIPIMGRLSDLLGHRRYFLVSALLWFILVYPIYLLLLHASAIAALIVFDILSSAVIGIFPAMLAELFPTKIRYTGVGFSYNVGFAIFAGLTPLVLTSLLHGVQHHIEIVAINIVLAAAISFISSLFMKDKTKLELN